MSAPRSPGWSRASPPRALLVLLGAAMLAALLFASRASEAADRPAEVAARLAMTRALKDHLAGDDDGAALVLTKARQACGSNRCSAVVRSALLRDLGAVTYLRGDRAKASGLFSDALDLTANLAWNPNYDTPELTAEWAAVKNERAAIREPRVGGDFEHVPEVEQTVDTPLPIYAELTLSGVAKVVVKYKVPGSDEFKRRTLPRFGGGWGGTIPCEDVKRGLVRYFLQAFDAEGVPLANSGDVKHLYFVPIRWAISGEPPHLPGQSPPEACNGRPAEPEVVEPVAGATPAAAARYVHFWVGVSGSIDLTLVPSGSDVCALNSSLAPVNSSFYCTNPDGSDFPSRSKTGPDATPVRGGSGSSSGGPAAGNTRVLFTFDYAVNTHFMAGARIGYVAQSYPGAAASSDGHEIAIPVHVELRATYLFGEEPLARAGFAPYGFGSLGVAKIDVSQLGAADVVGVAGPRPILVWRMAGPAFAALGGGARYAFSPRVAFLAGLKAAVAFGPAGFLPILSPEVELQYGF